MGWMAWSVFLSSGPGVEPAAAGEAPRRRGRRVGPPVDGEARLQAGRALRVRIAGPAAAARTGVYGGRERRELEPVAVQFVPEVRAAARDQVPCFRAGRDDADADTVLPALDLHADLAQVRRVEPQADLSGASGRREGGACDLRRQ